jgi:hypothetical protein
MLLVNKFNHLKFSHQIRPIFSSTIPTFLILQVPSEVALYLFN